MNEVVAVVVTYNRKSLLKGCIQHLLSLQNAACDIMIVDNASTDGTYEMLEPYIAQGKIIYKNTGANLGGAGGFNFGMRAALHEGYTYAWIMDDDTFVEPDSLRKLLDADSELKGKYGFLSSIAYWTDGTICTMNRQKTGIKQFITDYESKRVPVIMATFVSFFVPIERIRKFGLPISDFFIWSDDLEYSRRISRELPSYVIPDSRVVHCMGSNLKVGIEQETEDRLWRYQYLYRNEVYVYRREGIKGWLYLFFRVLFHTAKVLVKAKEQKWKKLNVIWKSFISGFSFQPKVEFVEE